MRVEHVSQYAQKLPHRIPLVNALCSYPQDAHAQVFGRFFTLWILSVLPILFAIIFVPARESATLWSRFTSGILATDQFIYAVSFLSPMLLTIWDRYKERGDYIDSGKRSRHLLSREPSGFNFVMASTLIVFAFTACAYGITKAWDVYLVEYPDGAAGLGLPRLNPAWATSVYVYSLYCWYLTLLMGSEVAQPKFVETNRSNEKKMKDDFGNRLVGEECE